MFIRATAKKLLIAFSGCTLAMARPYMCMDIYANTNTHTCTHTLRLCVRYLGQLIANLLPSTFCSVR